VREVRFRNAKRMKIDTHTLHRCAPFASKTLCSVGIPRARHPHHSAVSVEIQHHHRNLLLKSKKRAYNKALANAGRVIWTWFSRPLVTTSMRLRLASMRVWKTRRYLLAALELEGAWEIVQKNMVMRESVVAAVRRNWRVFGKLPATVQTHVDFCAETVCACNHSDIFRLIPEAVLNDDRFRHRLAKEGCVHALDCASVREDESFVRALLQVVDFFDLSNEHQPMEEVGLAAVETDGDMFSFLSRNLQHKVKIIYRAIKKDPVVLHSVLRRELRVLNPKKTWRYLLFNTIPIREFHFGGYQTL